MYSHRRCQNRSPWESRAGALGAPPPWGLGYKSGQELARLMSKEISGDPKLYAESFEHARGVSARLRQPVRAGGPRAV